MSSGAFKRNVNINPSEEALPVERCKTVYADVVDLEPFLVFLLGVIVEFKLHNARIEGEIVESGQFFLGALGKGLDGVVRST